jgi:hypothetical protein
VVDTSVMEAAPKLPGAKLVVSAQAFLVTMQRINEMEARHTAQMKRLRQAWTHVVDAHQRRGDAETAVAQAQHQHRLAVEMENLLQTDFISATEDLEQRRETSKACQAGIVRRMVQATFAGNLPELLVECRAAEAVLPAAFPVEDTERRWAAHFEAGHSQDLPVRALHAEPRSSRARSRSLRRSPSTTGCRGWRRGQSPVRNAR